MAFLHVHHRHVCLECQRDDHVRSEREASVCTHKRTSVNGKEEQSQPVGHEDRPHLLNLRIKELAAIHFAE